MLEPSTNKFANYTLEYLR